MTAAFFAFLSLIGVLSLFAFLFVCLWLGFSSLIAGLAEWALERWGGG